MEEPRLRPKSDIALIPRAIAPKNVAVKVPPLISINSLLLNTIYRQVDERIRQRLQLKM